MAERNGNRQSVRERIDEAAKAAAARLGDVADDDVSLGAFVTELGGTREALTILASLPGMEGCRTCGHRSLVHVFEYAEPVYVSPTDHKTSDVVGVPGFEPGTPCPPGRCATGLRHTPTRPTDGSHERTLRMIQPITCVSDNFIPGM